MTMHYVLLITTISLFGFPDTGSTNPKISYNNGWIKIDDYNKYGISKLKRDLDKGFAQTFGKPHDPDYYINRSNASDANSLDLNLVHIGRSVSNEIKLVLKNLGLLNTKSNENVSLFRSRHGTGHRLKHNFTSATKFQSSSTDDLATILKNVLINSFEWLTGDCVFKKGCGSSSFGLPQSVTWAPGQLRLATTINAFSDYINSIVDLVLSSNSSRIFIIDAFGRLTQHPPKVTANIVRARLKKSLPKNTKTYTKYKGYQVQLCRVFTQNFAKNFQACLRSLELAEQYALNRTAKTGIIGKSLLKSSENLIKSIKNLHTGCRVQQVTTMMQILCGDDSSGRYLELSVEKILGRPWGRYFQSVGLENLKSSAIVQELLGLMKVRQHLRHKQKQLWMMALSNKRAKKQYKKLTKSLKMYEANLVDVGLHALKHVHQIATAIQKVFVRTALKSTAIDLSGNLRSLDLLGSWYNMILQKLENYGQLFFGLPTAQQSGHKNDTESEELNINDRLSVSSKPAPPDSNDEDSNFRRHDEYCVQSSNKFPKNKIHTFGKANFGIFQSERKELQKYERSSSQYQSLMITPWLEALKGLARVQTRRRPSTIMTLANTFLLATLFYECIAVLANTIYRTETSETFTPTEAVTQHLPPAVNTGDSDPDQYGDDYSDSDPNMESEYSRKRIRMSFVEFLKWQSYKADACKKKLLPKINQKTLKNKNSESQLRKRK